MLVDRFYVLVKDDIEEPDTEAGLAVREAASNVGAAVPTLQRNESTEYVATLDEALRVSSKRSSF